MIEGTDMTDESNDEAATMPVLFHEREFYALSNFSAFGITWRQKYFQTAEAAYQWEKFLGCDRRIGKAIQEARSPYEVKRIAAAFRDSRRENWDEIKVDAMREILLAKIGQHEYVRIMLLATGEREIIEDSDNALWGWGPDRNGMNALGRLWMHIRTMITTGTQEGQSHGR